MANLALSQDTLLSSRVPINMDDVIHDLNINKTPLLKLLSMVGKSSTDNSEYEWMTEERMGKWGTTSAFGGAWAAGAATGGTITVDVATESTLAVNDVIKLPTDTNVNIYITAINTTTHVITAHTFDNTTTIDLSAGTTGSQTIYKIGNAFEEGSGRGTITNKQPTDNYNYIQTFQTPIGVTETLQATKLRGGVALDRERFKKGIEHAFDIETTLFFGQKYKASTGYMNGEYAQYFTGGLLESVTTNVQDESAGTLTQTEFNTWMKDATYYSEKPVVLAGDIIFEGLNKWADGKLQISQNEKVLGMNMTKYLTPYGKTVTLIPHRELLKNSYAGYAFCVDLNDIKYKYLNGKDTKIVPNIQANDIKQRIDEYRTWAGLWIGNEKRHAVLKNVASIA